MCEDCCPNHFQRRDGRKIWCTRILPTASNHSYLACISFQDWWVSLPKTESKVGNGSLRCALSFLSGAHTFVEKKTTQDRPEIITGYIEEMHTRLAFMSVRGKNRNDMLQCWQDMLQLQSSIHHCRSDYVTILLRRHYCRLAPRILLFTTHELHTCTKVVVSWKQEENVIEI